MEILVLLLLAGLALVILPLLLLKLLISIVLLPFKLMGLVFKVVAGGFALVAKLVFGAAGLVLGLFACLLALVLLPLLPLLLLGGVIWLVVRAARPSSTAVRVVSS